MNTTVAVVLPEWMVYLLLIGVVLSIINTCMGIYVEYLKAEKEYLAQQPMKVSDE